MAGLIQFGHWRIALLRQEPAGLMENLLHLPVRCTQTDDRDSDPKCADLSFRPSVAFTLRAQSVQIGSPADLSSHSHLYDPHKEAQNAV
jgi:hypothetical protein